MTFEDVTKFLNDLKLNNTKFRFNDSKYIDIVETILTATKWMEDTEPFKSQSKPYAPSINNVTNKQRLEIMRQGIYSAHEYPKCFECLSNHVLISNNGDISKYCSKSCAAKGRKRLSEDSKVIFNDRNRLEQLYKEYGYNLKELSDTTGIKYSTLRRQFDNLNIPVSLSYGVDPEWFEITKRRDTLYDAYADCNHSTTLLAKRYSISPEAVQANMRKHKIQLTNDRSNNLYDQIRLRDAVPCHLYFGKSIHNNDIFKIGVTVSPLKRQRALRDHIEMFWISLPMERWKALVMEQCILKLDIPFNVDSSDYHGKSETFRVNDYEKVCSLFESLWEDTVLIEKAKLF